jgi:acyl-CoA thioesterase-1
MNRLVSSCLLVLLTVAFPAAAAQSPASQGKAKPRKTQPNPVLAPVADVAGLPRVLLIGDSISMGYTLAVRELLAGKANVHRPPTNCGPTIRGVEQIDAWLGDGQWDVIHFNFGLHDLKIMDDGKHQVALDQYDKNLRQLVARMQKTKAKLIWCSTTPVPESSSPPRHNADVLAYNTAAKKIMDEQGIAIDDLYAFALPQLAKIQLPNNVHFSADGSKVLARQVAESIEKALK